MIEGFTLPRLFSVFLIPRSTSTLPFGLLGPTTVGEEVFVFLTVISV